MRYKITNFYNNIKLNLFSLKILFVFLFASSIAAQSNYKMTIDDVLAISDTSLEACVYIENVNTSLKLTSYQCALSIDQSIDLSSLKLSYIEGTSELLNEPNLYVGVDNIDGPTELTFVSFIGNDIITKKTLIGRFFLSGKFNSKKIENLNIQWNFEGTMSTIITGENFLNITNPNNHSSIFLSNDKAQPIVKLEIVDSEASNSSDPKFNHSMLYDGINSSTSINTNSNSAGRWLAEGFSQWVTFDLGKYVTLDYINLDPFGSEDGIFYTCEFYSGKFENKQLITAGKTQINSQWSEFKLQGVKTRYVTMVVTGSNGNDYTDFWEVEIFGSSSTTDIEEENEEESSTQESIPDEYSLSQNYPNPFNPATKIEVKMKESGNAKINVYNLLGEKIISVLDQELSAGIHEINIDGSRLASGVYIYKLDIGNKYSQVKKMNLIK